nr:DUF6185 family protein [Streptomyces sp. SID13031]
MSNCTDNKLRGTYGTVNLELNAKHVDDVRWVSTVQISVPAIWGDAQNLLKDRSSQEFTEAVSCFFDADGMLAEVSLVNDRVILKYRDEDTVSAYETVYLSPWRISTTGSDFSVTLDSSLEQKSSVPWKTVTAVAFGFRFEEPSPLPASFSRESSQLQWMNLELSNPGFAKPSFKAVPERALDTVYYLETGGYGQYIPRDAQEFLLWGIMALALAKRATRGSSIEFERGRRTLRMISLILAAFALSEITYDIASQIPFPVIDSSWVGISAISSLALLMIWRSGRRRRPLFSLLILAAAAGALLLQTGFIGLLTGIVALLLAWLVTTSAAITMLTAHRSQSSRLSRRIAFGASVPLAVSALVALASAYYYRESTLSDSVGVLRQWLPVIAIVGIVLLVATRYRRAPLILESRDHFLLAQAVAAVLLLTAPQWYLGLHFNVASVVGFASTFLLLTASQHLVLLRSLRHLLGVTPATRLKEVQQKLLTADRRVTELSADLKALEGKPLTIEQVHWRESLKTEMETLHRWPIATTDHTTTRRRRLRFGGRRQQSGPAGPAGEPLPGRAHPVDVALALGTTDLLRNVATAAKYSAIVAVPLGCYFTYKSTFPERESFAAFYWLDPSFGLLGSLVNEVLFWIIPPMLLGIAWSSLVGRRGSNRALFIWLCVAVPLGVHVALNQALHQSSSLNIALRSTLVFFITFVVGLMFDLRTLAGQRTHESPFKLFQSYLGLGRVLPTLLLVIPLVTGTVTLWSQISKGVLEQKTPPSQTEPRQTTTPTPTSSS